MVFSNRTPNDLSHNPITLAVSRLKKGSYLDLTESNPTHCGFLYPKDLFQNLSSPLVFDYEPDPFGNFSAREAVSNYLRPKGCQVNPANLLLTASTSEAYSYLFKLLGNPGDSFLVPAPGYPLLDHLLSLEGLEPLPYPFLTLENWPVDLVETQKVIRANTRGLIVVNPHNPTGCFLGSGDQKAIWGLCREHRMAYISDEVFSDFAYPGYGPAGSPPFEFLSFRLGGLSKSLGLPQLKLSWIAMEGPEDLLAECRERLELIADTYLSVNRPVQAALEDLLRFAPLFQAQVAKRVSANRLFLEKALEGLPGIRVWRAQGGWYALVEAQKKGIQDGYLALKLLEKNAVFVQPGGFYDFRTGCFLVLSLLLPEAPFQEGVRRLREGLKMP